MKGLLICLIVLLFSSCNREHPNSYEIWYTTTDGQKAHIFKESDVVSHKYMGGIGVITTRKSITCFKCWLLEAANIKSVIIPNGVISIEDCAFQGTSLTSITIPDSVTSIGINAFSDCTSLKAFYGKFASADNRCLIVDGVLNSFAIGCGATEYTIPNSVTSIGKFAFYDCTSLTSVTIPDSVTSIGDDAFRICTSLKRVDITDLSAWCKINFSSSSANPLCNGAKLYLNGSELTDITIPSDITEIKAYAFYNFTSLTSVTIPDSVTSIGDYAFSDCTSLKTVYCKPTTPPMGSYDMFSYNYNYETKPIGCKIYVPRNSVEAYKAAKYWSSYASYIVGYDF